MGQFFILRSRVQQEYNSLLVNALNRIFKSNLSLNNFKWLFTKLELSCVRNIIPRSRKRLWNGYPVLNPGLQNHDPVGRHIPVEVMYGSIPPPGIEIHFSGGCRTRSSRPWDKKGQSHRDMIICVAFLDFFAKEARELIKNRALNLYVSHV